MEPFLLSLFGLMSGVAAALEWTNRHGRANKSIDQAFNSFKNNYVVVYSLMMAGDWLQGPYVYALYQHYGFSHGDIGRLFIAGFGSSMVFGTLVGSLADKHGRKRAALTYVAVYSAGCLTKHFNRFGVLFFGRLLCGVATSLLYSAFESWLVCEHSRRGHASESLGVIFSQAVFFGNGVMAIAAGLVAQSLVETLALGPVAPFDAAILVMLLGGAIVAATWNENYGERRGPAPAADGGVSPPRDSPGAPPSHARVAVEGNAALQAGSPGAGAQFAAALRLVAREPRIALLGAMQSMFEGSMYTFVFLWTPALAPNQEGLPHGAIFACFMVSSMVGSALVGRLLTPGTNRRVERYMQVVFVASAACLLVPVFVHSGGPVQTVDPATGGLALWGRVQLAAFCCFELLVGMFWPSMMTMRSAHVPEEMRSTVINIFRVPLNLFVCLVMYNVEAVPLSHMFAMCVAFLLLCAACQNRFAALVARGKVEEQGAQMVEVAITA